MENKIKKDWKKILLLILSFIIIVLIFSLFKSCDNIKKQKLTIQTINALNDSLVLIKNKKDTFWQKQVITLHPKEIKKQDLKSNDNLTNQFLKELENEKKLSAALRLQILVKDSLSTNLVKDTNNININNLCNQTFLFNDSLDNLIYSGIVDITDDDSKVYLNYTYKLNLKTIVTEDDNKYIAKYYINDKNAIITGADFILIPKPKYTKWDKSKKFIIPFLSCIIGFCTGYGIYKIINK